MVIILLVFGIAMMIYSNVSRVSLSVQKIKANAILIEELRTAESTGLLADKTIDTAGLTIEQSIKPVGEDTALNTIRLTAYDQNRKQIAALEKIIRR